MNRKTELINEINKGKNMASALITLTLFFTALNILLPSILLGTKNLMDLGTDILISYGIRMVMVILVLFNFYKGQGWAKKLMVIYLLIAGIGMMASALYAQSPLLKEPLFLISCVSFLGLAALFLFLKPVEAFMKFKRGEFKDQDIVSTKQVK